MRLRSIPGIIGVFFLLQAINWIVNPTAAAEALGMPLLDGAARSTQIGDIAAFFFALGTMSLLGAIYSNAQWLRAGALLIASAAVMRTLAWAVQDAAFSAAPIAVETVTAALLLFVASRFGASGHGASEPSSN